MEDFKLVHAGLRLSPRVGQIQKSVKEVQSAERGIANQRSAPNAAVACGSAWKCKRPESACGTFVIEYPEKGCDREDDGKSPLRDVID